jgi:uncharacterized repeat protein (TIGR02543 family)
MSLKTFFKTKLNRIITALTVLAVAGAGISVGAVVGNNKAQETDAITNTVYVQPGDFGNDNAYISIHLWGGNTGTGWPGIKLGQGTGTTILSADCSTYTGFTHCLIMRWSDGNYSTEWNRWNYYNNNTFTAGINKFVFSSWSPQSGNNLTGSGNFTISTYTEATSYTVTFNGNNGTVFPSTQTVTSGGTFTTPTTLTYTGHTFSSWNTAADASGTTYIANSTAITSNVTLYAIWTTNTYTVTFNGNNGTASPSTQTVSYNGTFSNPTTLTRDGYTFSSWNTAADGSGTTYTAGTTKITAAVTLYAIWQSAGYTASEYRVLDGTAETTVFNTVTNLTSGSTFATPSAPSYTNYIFVDWYTTSACSTKYTGSTVSASFSLYAKFVSGFSLRGSVIGWGTDTTLFSYSNGVYSLTRDFAAGEEFKAYKLSATTAWYGKTASGSDKFSSTYFGGSDNISSTYALNFTLTFTYSGGTFTWTGATCNTTYTISEYRVIDGSAEGTAFNTTTAVARTSFAKPADVSYSTYEFKGWYSDSTCTVEYTATTVTAAMSLYAKFSSAVTYTIYECAVYDGYYGSLTGATYYEASTEVQLGTGSASSNAAFPAPTQPTKDNYTSSGWYTDPACTTSYDPTTIWTAVGYLYAKYTSSDTSHNAIYLTTGDTAAAAYLLNVPSNHFLYSSSTGRYELSHSFVTNDTFYFYDFTKSTSSSPVLGGYLASAFNDGNFSGTQASVITYTGSGAAYSLSIISSISSATANYYGYWYQAVSGSYSGNKNIYLYGPFKNYSKQFDVYKFTWNSTYQYYELYVDLVSGADPDKIEFYYVEQSGYGTWNSVVFSHQTGGVSDFLQESGTNYIKCNNPATYHLTIKGSIENATSDFPAYWSDATYVQADRTYGYVEERQILGATVGTADTNVLGGTLASSTTLTNPATVSGYTFQGWYSDSAHTTAITSVTYTSANQIIYAYYTATAYDNVYFGTPTGVDLTSTNLYVYMWYRVGSTDTAVTGAWPGNAVSTSPNADDISIVGKTSANLRFADGITGYSTSNIDTQILKLQIPETIFDGMPSGATKYIIFNFGGSATQTNDSLYVLNGYYYQTNSSTRAGRNSDTTIAAGYDAAAKLAYDLDQAITNATSTNGNGSVCGISTATASSLYSAYTALGTNYSGAKTMFDACYEHQYTLTDSSPIWNGTKADVSLGATMLRVQMIATGSGSGALQPHIGERGSAISWTLIIVASCGASSLLMIAGIYLFSRKKKRHPDSMA